MERYHTVLWDVDQTLLDFKASERYAVRHCFESFHLTATEDILTLYSSINQSYWKRIEKGELNKKEALVGRFCTLFEQTGITGIEPSAFQERYADALGSVYYFQDHSYELVKSLKGKYRQYLVTNGISRTQRNKLKLSGLDLLVDGIFISEELGAPKPQKAYFDACFSRIPGFEKEKTILVGDSLSSDILGANQAGITSCWYNPDSLKNDSQAVADFEIKNLSEILPVLSGEEKA